MKQYLKYFQIAPIILAIIFFFLWKGQKTETKHKNTQLFELREDSISTHAELGAVKDFVNKLQQSKTQVEETYIDKIGHWEKLYAENSKKLSEALNKPPQTIIIKDTVLGIETLSDVFKTDNLILNYTTKTKGNLLKIDFDYSIKEKIVTKEHIIFEDKPYSVIVPVKKSHLVLNYNYGMSKLYRIHDFNISYLHKDNFGVNAGLILIDNNKIGKIGISVYF
jgi:regulatory protein YycI of two-component signal transduction system YycFG